MIQVKIKKKSKLSDTVYLYSLSAQDYGQIFIPGQYLSFIIPGQDKPKIRAYSFCSSPEKWPDFELCVKQVPDGVGTNYLLNNIGNTVKTSGPQGDFVLPEKINQDAVFIAGGVGIAPVRSMLSEALESSGANKVRLVYRFPSEEEFLFEQEFTKIQDRYENFKLFTSSSQEQNRDSYTKQAKEFLTKLQNPMFYIVGSPSFVKQNTDLARSLGYDEYTVKTDIWEV